MVCVYERLAELMGNLFPAAEQMQELAGYVGVWVAYGIGLSIVFWTLGFVVWAIIQFLR